MKLTLDDHNESDRSKRYALIEEEPDCPRYECVELESPEEDRNCSYIGNSLTSLDEMLVRTDLCHHTLFQTNDGHLQIECKSVYFHLTPDLYF